MPEHGPAPAPSPRIGDKAPDFTARTTQGMVTLGQFRGRWLVLFSHPADFTPVCTSEFIAFVRHAADFAALDCALLGHSVDSLFSHLAWLRLLRDEFGAEVTFPVIEDPTMEIARGYGMISADEATAASVRAVYVIDPAGVIRAINWYPINVGRSVAEILRLVAALQRAEDGPVITPEGWQPGDDVLAPPGTLTEEALASKACSGWFYREIKT
ncbi:MAG: peroxiredoxin [Sphingomonadales bacterium]|nr:peroxiredoxin [Sphingomonadales bacterium]